MAELPELTILQQQMDQALRGRQVAAAEVRQEKCLNLPVDQAVDLLQGRHIEAVSRKGKWLCLHLQPAYYLLLNLGMGADLWHYGPGEPLPEKYQFRLHLDDGSGFTCRFWWFGHIRLLSAAELPDFPETAKLGPSPLEVGTDAFITIARQSPRSTAKSLILDQSKLSGIGNAYAHDILWTAHLHPLRKLGSLTNQDLHRYHEAIRQVMERAIRLGGWERNFFRQGGNVENTRALWLVGYREGEACPSCGTPIQKIKTGATATFICPTCQPL